MKLKDATKDKLRAAWHGRLSAEHIAGMFHLGVGTLRNFWTAEKKAGRLPDLPCRPAFAAKNPPPEPAPPITPADAVDDALDREIERSERASDLSLVAGDPLLDALKAAHGRDRLRRLVLRVPNDRKETPLDVRTRSLAWCLARRWDEFVISKMKERRP